VDLIDWTICRTRTPGGKGINWQKERKEKVHFFLMKKRMSLFTTEKISSFFSNEPSNCKQLVMNNKQYSNEEIDVSLFTTEKLSSSELYNHWNYNNEKKNLCNEFINRVEALE